METINGANASLKNVRSYNDLRTFLKDFVGFKKQQDTTWTMTIWAQDLGLKALTSITMIINGQRNCGKSIEEALAKYFQFTSEEERHFRLLVKKDKLRANDPVKDIVESELKTGATPKKKIVLSEEDLIKITKWQYFALRQLGRLGPLPNNEQQLRSLLNYNSEESLLEGLLHLEQLGLVKKQADQFVTTEKEITSAQNVSSEPIKQYHESMAQVAFQAIRKIDPSQRSFQGRTLPVKKENLAKAKALIEKFQSDFDSLVDDPSGDSVYQLNVQFFPLGEKNV